MHREVGGVFYNYKIKFGNSVGNPKDYDALWEVLTSPDEFHIITAPYGENGSHTYKAYIASVKDKLMTRTYAGKNFWNSLTASFIAESPART